VQQAVYDALGKFFDDGPLSRRDVRQSLERRLGFLNPNGRGALAKGRNGGFNRP
jgi:hypothetical protein